MNRSASSTYELSGAGITPVAASQEQSQARSQPVADPAAGVDQPLWTRRQVVLLAVGLGVGLAVIAFSWYGSSGTRHPADQVRWVAVSVAGLALSTLVNVGWVLRSRRAIGLELRTLPAQLGWDTSSTPTRSGPAAADVFVSAARSTLYHRSGCALAGGRTVESATRAAHERANLSPCEVCQP